MISFVCSVFNCKKWLERYLHNMTAMEGFSRHELVLVHPEGPEKEHEQMIIKLFTDRLPNIRYVRVDQSLPLYAAWNLGIQNASGEFVSNANPDDRKLNSFILDFERAIADNPSTDVFYADSLVAYNAVQLEVPDFCIYRHQMPEISAQSLIVYNPPHQAPVWRKSLHQRFGMFSDNFGVAGDHEFWLRCFAGGATFQKIEKVCGVYYHNPEGLSTQRNQERAMQSNRLKQEYAQKLKYYGPLHGRPADIIKPL